MTLAEMLDAAATEAATSPVVIHSQNRHGTITQTDIGLPLAALLRHAADIARKSTGLRSDGVMRHELALARAILGEVAS